MAIYLRPVTFNPKAPAWMLPGLLGDQAIADMVYTDSMERFNSAALSWIEAEKHGREISPNPAAYNPNPFTIPIPKREIFDGTPAGVPISTFETDPLVKLPSLPDFEPGAPAVVIATDVVDKDAADEAFKAAMMKIATSIAVDVAAIKKRVGA